MINRICILYPQSTKNRANALIEWPIVIAWLIRSISKNKHFFLLYTVEPPSNNHPHQRPSLLYDHILCDGHCFLFVRSLTNDHPSDATNDRVRWDFLYSERPPRLQGISKNRGWRFNIRSQSCIITMLCLDTFQVIQLI